MQQSSSETINQLEKARKLALGDSAYYPQIVPGVLPIIGPAAPLDLRRWGADFLAETFASPTLASDAKQNLSLQVVQVLRQFLEAQTEDPAVIKSVVQTATSVYPLVFKHTISNPTDSQTWGAMAAIKSSILRRMDKEPSGVKVCCVKFIQRVVQVQTPGQIADPRRPDQNETSLAIVPRDHPLIPPSNLEAEAFGLLDRLLGVFQEATSDALAVTATLNSIGILVRTRPSISNRILTAVLSFNPFRFVGSVVTPRIKVNAKSMEKTIRAFLINFTRRMPNHPSAGRIQGYLDRLQQQRMEFLDPNSRKRPAPVEPTDGLDPNKRARLGADIPEGQPQFPAPPPLPPGPVSVAQLFTLTADDSRKSFDVQAIPFDLVSRILVPLIASIDVNTMNHAINAVRSRYLDLSKPPPPSAVAAAAAATGQNLPAFPPSQMTEQLYNRLDNAPSEGFALAQQPEISLGPFIVPQPPPLTAGEVSEHGKGAVTRVFESFATLEETVAKTSKPSFVRRAAGNQDRDSWVTVIARLATRALSGLDGASALVKQESSPAFSISNSIRDAMHLYIIGDFRRRIDTAISWLNEEWYNDQLNAKADDGTPTVRNYERLVLKLIDALVPYLDAKDNKVLIRFLSEIPAVNEDILDRIKKLARDPERVPLAVTSIHYLILFRPPVRDLCVDAVADLYLNYADAKAATTKLLQKWRPSVLQVSAEPSMNLAALGSPAPVKPEVTA